MERPDQVHPPVAPVAVEPMAPATMEQISAVELADLRRRAERYRFLFKTIVTVTSILVGATLIVVLVALLTDL
jgi:hypothetical protein